MKKTGIIALLAGIVLVALGGIAIGAFPPEVIIAIKGLVGIAVVCVALMLIFFSILIVED
ncbi:MAG: hypothetical protein WCF90_02960 [Methanomicrobiales archaeon]